MAGQKVRYWRDVAEVGSGWGIGFVLGLCALLGRGAARAFVRVIALYYLLFRPIARRASRDYLRLALGRSSSWMIYRHLVTFADVVLDRALIATGRGELFKVTCTGQEHLARLAAEKRGALLLGAHLGSFEAMRLGAVTESLPINMVVDFGNARRITRALERLDPRASPRLLSVEEGAVVLMLRIRECVERGEMVAILADRVGCGTRETRADFLGAEAAFAASPFILASVLRCPVYLIFGLYRGGNRYELYCEPFSEHVELPRRERERALGQVVQRFADRLAHYARLAPYNWFNFYDFWRV